MGCFLQVCTLNEEPQYAEVKKILVQKDFMIRFLTSKWITVGWNDHFQAYEVEQCPPQQINLELVKHSQLSYFLALHIVKPSGHHTMMSCVAPRYEIGEI